MIKPDGVLDGDHGETVAVWFGVGHGQSDYPDPIKATQPAQKDVIQQNLGIVRQKDRCCAASPHDAGLWWMTSQTRNLPFAPLLRVIHITDLRVSAAERLFWRGRDSVQDGPNDARLGNVAVVFDEVSVEVVDRARLEV